MTPRRKTPLLLLTGFLGSGKTTLLRRWLTEAAFANTLVLVNEIGEVGIDQQILAPAAGDPVLLENGCLCCDAGGDLVAALEQIFFDRLHRKRPDFDKVVIETSGLAAPGAVLAALSASEILRERYAPPVVLATFDAKSGPAQWRRHPEVRDQISCAHAIILTRTDLASDEELADARALLQHEREGADILSSGRERLDGALIAELLTDLPLGGEEPGPRQGATHTPGVTTAFAALPDAVSKGALNAALISLFETAGSSILRVKGFVKLSDEGWTLVQADPSGIIFETATGLPDKAGLTLIAEERSAQDLAASLIAKMRSRPLGSPWD